MSQIKCKKIQSLQELVSSCKRNGQVLSLQTIAANACDRDCTSRCTIRSFPKR